MTASDALRPLILALEGEVEHWRQLKASVIETLTRLPAQQPSAYDMRSVAMLLTEIYLGAENLMRQVAKRLNESVPTGSAWHQELLAQLSREAPGLRPALFSAPTHSRLDEYRRFRHVVHHAYATVFDWTQMAKLLSQATPLLDSMTADAEAFKEFLVAASQDMN